MAKPGAGNVISVIATAIVELARTGIQQTCRRARANVFAKARLSEAAVRPPAATEPASKLARGIGLAHTLAGEIAAEAAHPSAANTANIFIAADIRFDPVLIAPCQALLTLRQISIAPATRRLIGVFRALGAIVVICLISIAPAGSAQPATKLPVLSVLCHGAVCIIAAGSGLGGAYGWPGRFAIFRRCIAGFRGWAGDVRCIVIAFRHKVVRLGPGHNNTAIVILVGVLRRRHGRCFYPGRFGFLIFRLGWCDGRFLFGSLLVFLCRSFRLFGGVLARAGLFVCLRGNTASGNGAGKYSRCQNALAARRSLARTWPWALLRPAMKTSTHGTGLRVYRRFHTNPDWALKAQSCDSPARAGLWSRSELHAHSNL